MTAGQIAQPAHDSGTLLSRLRALERQLQQAGHTVRLLPAEANAALIGRLLRAFAASGDMSLLEVLYDLTSLKLLDALRATIVAENLAFDPIELLPELMARLMRSAASTSEAEAFEVVLEQFAKSVVLDAQKAASRSLVREQRAAEIEFPDELGPACELDA